MRLPQARLDQVLDRFQRGGGAHVGRQRRRRDRAPRQGVRRAEAGGRVRRALAKPQAERAELETMAAGDDAEMADLAREELAGARRAPPALERELALLLAPRDADENASAILEVRAGTGGDEAALFAGDLFRMYQRYAAAHGWKVEVESESEGEMGGYKEIIASIDGEGVFGRLKFESGVHRVQRVPDDRGAGAHPHLRRHRRGAARGRGRRDRDQRRRPAHRHLPLLAAPAASTSTRPTRRCASPTCPPASSSPRRRSRSTRTGRGR